MTYFTKTPQELPLIDQLLENMPNGTFMVFNEQTQSWMRASYSRLGDGRTLRLEKVISKDLPPRPVQPSFESDFRNLDISAAAWPCLNPWAHGIEGWWSDKA